MPYSQLINRDRLIGNFLEMININSPSFQEEALGELLGKKLRESGCSVEMQRYEGSFNLIAFKKGTDINVPPLLLSGHMDTIEPTTGIRFSIDEGRIRSVGNTVLGADDKSALAEILEAITVINENRLDHGDIEIVFTSGEEKGLTGAKNLDFALLRSKHALVLDSSGKAGSLIIAAPSHLTYKMQITGKPAHAGIEPEKGVSSIRVAARIISEVPDGRIDAVTTANIGIISGGTATNVVPKETIIHGEIRSHDIKTLGNIREKIFDTAAAIATHGHAVVDITDEQEYHQFAIMEDDPFLKYVSAACADCGIQPRYTVTGGGSDANIFNRQGIKTINMSSGMQNVHSPDEYIDIDDLVNVSRIVLQSITGFTKFVP